jgi:EmrB/QacA subfamily drug resistance transporter
VKAKILAPENRKWWTLAAVCFSLFMIMLDNTVVNVALFSIQRDLHIGITQLEWIVSAYILTFAVLMLSGGKLADLYGRKRIFLTGLAIFTLSSLACALSTSADTLIGARAVQGVGAALMMPSTLSIISAAFHSRERGTAIGIWAGVSAMALAIGPLVGGLIVEHNSWNWILYVNVPIGALGFVVGLLVIRESRDTSAVQRLDLPGLLTSGFGLLALVYALTKGGHPDWAWSSGRVLGLFAASVVLFALFVVLELKQRAPMLDLSLFRDATFASANVVALLVSLAMFGVFFFMSLYMQQILHYSAVRNGATFLPMTILIILGAPIVGRATDKIGSRWLMATGMTLTAVSLYLFSQLGLHSTFWTLLPGMLIGGLGMAITMTPMTTAALGAVPVAKAGVASGVLNTFRQIGGSLGIAIMGALLSNQTASALHGGASQPEAFVHGLSVALRVSAVIALAAALIAATFIRKARHGDASVAVEAVGA